MTPEEQLAVQLMAGAVTLLAMAYVIGVKFRFRAVGFALLICGTLANGAAVALILAGDVQ